MSQQDKELDYQHGPPADNRAQSGGHGGIPESSCASAFGLNRKAPVLHSPIPGRSDSSMQNGEVGPGLGAGIEEQTELGPPETKPLLRLPGRAQGPRGSSGQTNDFGPKATQSGRATPPHLEPSAERPNEGRARRSEEQILSSLHAPGTTPAAGRWTGLEVRMLSE